MKKKPNTYYIEDLVEKKDGGKYIQIKFGKRKFAAGYDSNIDREKAIEKCRNTITALHFNGEKILNKHGDIDHTKIPKTFFEKEKQKELTFILKR